MPYVIAGKTEVYWAVGDPIVAADIMEPGGLTVTGLVLYSDTDAARFIAKTAGKISEAIKPLNVGTLDVGAKVDAGVYRVGKDLVVVKSDRIVPKIPISDGVDK